MIKIQITDTEDSSHDQILEGRVILFSVINENGDDLHRVGGIVGKGEHQHIVSLVATAADVAADVLGPCRACRLEAIIEVAKSLSPSEVSRVDMRLETLRNPPVDPLAKTTQPEPETAEA